MDNLEERNSKERGRRVVVVQVANKGLLNTICWTQINVFGTASEQIQELLEHLIDRWFQIHGLTRQRLS